MGYVPGLIHLGTVAEKDPSQPTLFLLGKQVLFLAMPGPDVGGYVLAKVIVAWLGAIPSRMNFKCSLLLAGAKGWPSDPIIAEAISGLGSCPWALELLMLKELLPEEKVRLWRLVMNKIRYHGLLLAVPKEVTIHRRDELEATERDYMRVCFPGADARLGITYHKPVDGTHLSLVGLILMGDNPVESGLLDVSWDAPTRAIHVCFTTKEQAQVAQARLDHVLAQRLTTSK